MKFFKNNKQKELFIRSVSGNLTNEEKKKLESFLYDAENKKELEKINSIWKNSQPPKADNLPDVDIEWALLQNRINLNEKKREKVSDFSKVKSEKKEAYWKPAFAVSIVLLIIAAVFLFNKKDETINYQTIATISQEIKEVKLPDGSVVSLNSVSSLTFPEKFNGSKREVELSGEAFFSVTKNEKPFIISTENAKVTVLGTKFNVYGRDNKTEVFVKEGSVNLAQKKISGKGVNLFKNQSSLVLRRDKPSTPVINDPETFLDWMEGKLVFREAPLKEIAAELERRYNVKIDLQLNGKDSETLTGTFEEDNIEDVLNMVCLASGMRFSKNNDNYVLFFK